MSKELESAIKKYGFDERVASFLEEIELLFTIAKDPEIHTDITMMELIEATSKDFNKLFEGLTEREKFAFQMGVVFREVGSRLMGDYK